MSCILSTITFLADLAEKHSLTPIITFDQPLYWKSNKILVECTDFTLQKVILLLGCFHTVMNILGCVGYLMEGSGLNDILGEIYGDNAVIHMLSGKTNSRALRGHLIIDQALSKLIIEKINDDFFISEFEPIYNDATEGKKET